MVKAPDLTEPGRIFDPRSLSPQIDLLINISIDLPRPSPKRDRRNDSPPLAG